MLSTKAAGAHDTDSGSQPYACMTRCIQRERERESARARCGVWGGGGRERGGRGGGGEKLHLLVGSFPLQCTHGHLPHHAPGTRNIQKAHRQANQNGLAKAPLAKTTWKRVRAIGNTIQIDNSNRPPRCEQALQQLNVAECSFDRRPEEPTLLRCQTESLFAPSPV